VAPSNPTIINNQLRVAGDNVGRDRPFGNERHDRRNRDTRANDARHATHDPVVHADPLELHFRSLRHPIHGEQRSRSITDLPRSFWNADRRPRGISDADPQPDRFVSEAIAFADWVIMQWSVGPKKRPASPVLPRGPVPAGP